MPPRKLTFAQRAKRMAAKFKPKVKAERSTTKGREYSQADAMSLVITAKVLENGSLQFTTKGRWVSLNEIMAKVHWSTDTGFVDIIKKKIRDSIRGIQVKFEAYRIELRYNSRLDDHNCVMMPKYFTDCIKLSYAKDSRGRYIGQKFYDESGKEVVKKILEFEGFITDDDKRYSRGTNLIPDESLPHNTYVMTYIPVVYEDFKRRGRDTQKLAKSAEVKHIPKARVSVHVQKDVSDAVHKRSPAKRNTGTEGDNDGVKGKDNARKPVQKRPD